MSKKTIAGLTVEIGGDTTKLGQALSDVDKRSTALSKELGEINKLLKLDPTNTELLAQKQKVLSEAIASTKERLEILKTAHEQAAEAAKSGNAEAEEKMRALEREIISTEQKLEGYEKAAKGGGEETQKLAKESEKAKQKLADMADKGADKAAKTLGALAAAAAATVAAVGKLVLKQGEAASSLGDLSAKTGLTVEQLQEYAYIAKMAGTDLDTVTGAQSKLIKSMANARKGTGDAAKAFAELGVAIVDNRGELRDHDEVFGELLQKLAAVPNETERDALAMQFFGKSAQELNPLIKAGADNIEAWTEQAHELGIVVSDEANGALNDMYQEVKTVGSQFEALKQNIAAKFAPIVTKLLKAVQDVIKKVQDELSKPATQKAIEKLGKTVTELIEKGVKKGVELLPKLIDAAGFLLSHIKEITIALGSTWAILKSVSVVNNATKAFQSLKSAFDAIKAPTDAAKIGVEGLGAATAATGLSLGATVGILGAVVAACGLFVKSGIDRANEQMAKLTKTSRELNDSVQATKDGLETAAGAYHDTVAETDAVIQVADQYISRLEELEEKGSLTAAEQLEYNELIRQINLLMPDLNLSLDEETGHLKGGADALRDQVDMWKQKIYLSAVEELLSENLRAQITLQREVNAATEDYLKKQADFARFKEIYDKINSGVSVTAEEVAELNEITSTYGFQTIGQFEKTVDAAKVALDNATEALEKNKQETEALSNEYMDAVDRLEECISKAEAHGKDTGRGFRRGLKSEIPAIRAAALEAGQVVSRALSEVLDIHSPSRVTEEFGEYTDEGMVLGMKKKLSLLLRTARETGGAVSDELQDSLAPAELPNVSGIMRKVSAQASGGGSLESKLDKILAAIEAGHDFILDGDTWVGATANRMDQAIGGIAVTAGRGTR